jgi:Gliding motility associated protein GldN/MORN repeat variant
MLRNFFVLAFICGGSLLLKAQKQTIDINQVTCNVETSNNRLDGNYTSYYPNGQLKATGQFSKNNRVGIWEVYDEQGKLLIQRNYANSLQFTQTIPANSIHKYNTDNNWDAISQETVWCRKRFWKTADAIHNPELFRNEIFVNFILNLYNQKQIQFFEDDRFLNEKKLDQNVEKNAQLVSFKIKEDGILDTRRFILDYRMLAINPIIKTASGTQELGWMNFPDLMNYMKKETNSDFLNAFSILMNHEYSASNYKAMVMPALTNNNGEQALPETYKNNYQDVLLIEKEHDVWLQFLIAKK